MLAELATDLDAVLAAHGGRTAVEFKYDGARIQVHADAERVAIWSRGLSDVTASLPDVVAAARGLGGAPFILDGEVVARDASGRPLPFQELMRRFRRLRGVDAHAEAMPLSIHFFDCLVSGGRSLIDEPAEARWAALGGVTGGRHLAERRIVATAEDGRAFEREALDAGHEGVMAKDPRSGYEPGGRGKRWFKLKVADTVDCVIVAADRGSGRRAGWLSNYHLAVRDGDGWAEVGAMTERLRALATEDQGYTVRVRPEVVVEVAYNEVQRSPTYPSGFALRFARILHVREDKRPADATTLGEVAQRFEQQFRTKGRR
jgi:DNA ligase-1